MYLYGTIPMTNYQQSFQIKVITSWYLISVILVTAVVNSFNFLNSLFHQIS